MLCTPFQFEFLSDDLIEKINGTLAMTSKLIDELTSSVLQPTQYLISHGGDRMIVRNRI